MSSYWSIFKAAWQQNLVYRVNFTLWRIRSVLQLLLVYFIWWTVFQSQERVFGYTENSILTYVLVAALIRAIVLSTRVTDMGGQINDGSIVNFLVKPLGFIRYYVARDIADKLFNIVFYVLEISLIILFLKPRIIIQTNLSVLTLFLLATLGGLIIYFCISFIISLLAFWVENSWGPLFLLTIFLEGFGGGLFPIDILPKGLFNILIITPFPYLIYFPAKLYLGGMATQELITGFSILLLWIFGLWFLMKWLIALGLRHYTAVGH